MIDPSLFQNTYYLLLFFLGLSIGSFLNVVIDRLPAGRSILGRSESDCCHRRLGFLDLIPLLSFLLSSGRCRHCGAKISLYYPLVELLTAFLTVVVGVNFCGSSVSIVPVQGWSAFGGNCHLSLVTLVNVYFLIVYFFTDLKSGLVSVPVVILNLIFILVFDLFFYFSGQLNSDYLILTSISALAASFFILFLIWITKGRGMGVGDVLLIFIFSLMTGFPNSLVMVFLSFVIGGIFSSLLLLVRLKKLGQTIPFGPFLSMATLITLFFGNWLLDFYRNLILK